jgi:hypothetical protein
MMPSDSKLQLYYMNFPEPEEVEEEISIEEDEE